MDNYGRRCCDTFRFKQGIKVSEARQRYIFSVSRMYKELSAEDKKKIKDLCVKAGGEYSEALFEFVTTDAGSTAITMRHYLSRSTLCRIVKKYYENFPDKI